MQRYIVMRVGQSIIALLILSMVIFALGRFSGDPVILLLPPDATQEAETYCGNPWVEPAWPIQYWKFMSNALQFDFGDSIKAKRPVMDLIGPKIMNSARLGLAGMVITLIIGVPFRSAGGGKTGYLLRRRGQADRGAGPVASSILAGHHADPVIHCAA